MPADRRCDCGGVSAVKVASQQQNDGLRPRLDWTSRCRPSSPVGLLQGLDGPDVGVLAKALQNSSKVWGGA
ncbi:Hypothetical protein SMAX5B_005416 [Scophthalmus maximus]|uniref:Uncharacterized protein n=1 Tax=Scophthalmus maximus TaxID=52904 RepID=A0A2U9B1U6_SCOMX|nr:Hypothetical protein SMAX5B_005416 [Scophthalmus maximus]